MVFRVAGRYASDLFATDVESRPARLFDDLFQLPAGNVVVDGSTQPSHLIARRSPVAARDAQSGRRDRHIASRFWASPLSVETSPLRRSAMAEARRKFDEDFKQGAVRLVRETGKPIAQVARELGVNEGTLGNWCAQDRRRQGEGALSVDEREELRLLRKENAELRMRCDVLIGTVERWCRAGRRRRLVMC